MPLAQAQETLYTPVDKKRRGIGIYTLTQLLSITGRGKGGERITGDIEQPIFYLTIDERIQIFRLSTPVFGVVSSRMNSISGLKWNVTSEKEQEDDLASQYKNMYQVAKEYEGATSPKYVIAKVKLKTDLMTAMPELLPDLSNFNQCLFRWSRNLKKKSIDEADQEISRLHQKKAKRVATGASPYPDCIGYGGLRRLLEDRETPFFLLFGTGWGLTQEVKGSSDYVLAPIEGKGYNHLSVRSAVAIILDRLLGDRISSSE